VKFGAGNVSSSSFRTGSSTLEFACVEFEAFPALSFQGFPAGVVPRPVACVAHPQYHSRMYRPAPGPPFDSSPAITVELDVFSSR